MLDIKTFDARQGGNVIYKALAHPLAAEAVAALYRSLAGERVALFDPDGLADALLTMHPGAPEIVGRYVQDVMALDDRHRPVTALPESGATVVLVCAFDAGRVPDRLTHLLPPGARIVSLDAARLPEALLTNPRRYLDKLNFATNFAFFRDQRGMHTRIVTANYWSGYGAARVRLWLRLFDASGTPIATWEEEIAPGASGVAIDSRAVRARFDLPEFCGQLFVHVIGAAGHDIVKYAVDTWEDGEEGGNGGRSLSCTHDANAWPSDRYAGLPAPRADERVILWVQNSHAVPIPAGAFALDRMGAEEPVSWPGEIGAYASVPVDVADLLPGVRWPEQIEIRAGRHVVRPRYEVIRGGLTRIAHPNVERADLRPDPGIQALHHLMGRGYLLPFPILPFGEYRTEIQPNPMAVSQINLPLRLELFAPDGTRVASEFLGNLPRNHDLVVDLDAVLPQGALPDGGHGELVYDFTDGGDADGWLHALFRAEHRASGHVAETSFGAHIYNTPMTYRDEPQSYSGPPPGLSTRLFLRLGEGGRQGFTLLIYPASGDWHAQSDTTLELHAGDGALVAGHRLRIARSGSAIVHPHRLFAADEMARAGDEGYVLIRDRSVRLFGYHGLTDGTAFSLDHMFGF